jgi:hypothetical protein
MGDRLKKTYKTFVGQNMLGGNVYRGDVLMGWVAYSKRNGVLWMGQGADKNEALADLALRMLGHDEESWRLKAVEA